MTEAKTATLRIDWHQKAAVAQVQLRHVTAPEEQHLKHTGWQYMSKMWLYTITRRRNMDDIEQQALEMLSELYEMVRDYAPDSFQIIQDREMTYTIEEVKAFGRTTLQA
ncbi:hypothetical protein [Deinococcus sonorensis]|uniref:Uncharacterized protein n=2 Tax=Deinococcus sonorensis TaxID=309891 RepID=A0AAU7U814_9DEIO